MRECSLLQNVARVQDVLQASSDDAWRPVVCAALAVIIAAVADQNFNAYHQPRGRQPWKNPILMAAKGAWPKEGSTRPKSALVVLNMGLLGPYWVILRRLSLASWIPNVVPVWASCGFLAGDSSLYYPKRK